jgi:hypothetical protein
MNLTTQSVCAAVLCIAALPGVANAEKFLVLQADETGTMVLLTGRTARSGHFATGVHLKNEATPQVVPYSKAPPYMSSVGRTMFDCDEPRYKLLEVSFFAELGAGGELTYLLKPETMPWKEVVPGSAFDSLRDLTCDPLPYGDWVFGEADANYEYAYQSPKASRDGSRSVAWMRASSLNWTPGSTSPGTVVTRFEFDCERQMERTTYTVGFQRPNSQGPLTGIIVEPTGWVPMMAPESPGGRLADEACGLQRKSAAKKPKKSKSVR